MDKGLPQQEPSAGSSLVKLPQLDGLRAVAVSAVLLEHFFWGHYLTHALPWGWLGVRLFFVISGFLITSILLECREISETTGIPKRRSIRQFYARRALRILPLYYLVLFSAAAIGVAPVRETFAWLATFTSNIYFALRGEWLPPVTHLWSLAVEEQFYLVWPWVILFVPRRHLPRVMLAAVGIALLWRTLSVAAGHAAVTTWVATPGSLDTLAMGSLLAIVRRPPHSVFTQPRRFAGLCLAIGAPLMVLTLGLHLAGISLSTRLVLSDLAMALSFTWLVSRAADGFEGWGGRLLNLAPVRYLGKISYGVYVYHLFVKLLLPGTLVRIGLSYPSGLAGELLTTGATIAIASASWHLFELPINSLKSHFPYRPTDENPPDLEQRADPTRDDP